MNTLHLPLQKKWFDLIKSGIKKEEYREIKPYFISRLINSEYFEYDIDGNLVLPLPAICDLEFRYFDTITFRNGYGKNVPTMVVECKGITVGKGNHDWGAPDDQVFIIKLGEILSVTE